MTRFFKKLWQSFHRLFSRKEIIPVIVDDLPENIRESKIYVVEGGGQFWFAGMLCPCGCKNLIHLNLEQDHDPHWKILIDPNEGVTLSPSVWRTTGCRSHFWVRKGNIYWVEPSGY